jgi:hypothetical protein
VAVGGLALLYCLLVLNFDEFACLFLYPKHFQVQAELSKVITKTLLLCCLDAQSKYILMVRKGVQGPSTLVQTNHLQDIAIKSLI